MLNYVNSFCLSTPEDQSKVILNLMQNYPLPTPEDDAAMKHELVSSIVLDADTAPMILTKHRPLSYFLKLQT